MDLLYSGSVDAFALVSSDSDFTRLATRLRESGKTVYGLGQRKTPASLQAACDKFIFLEVLRERDDDEEPVQDAEAEGDSLPDLRTILEAAVRSTAQERGGAGPRRGGGGGGAARRAGRPPPREGAGLVPPPPLRLLAAERPGRQAGLPRPRPPRRRSAARARHAQARAPQASARQE